MDYDLLIIGAGPAGYVAGIRAGQVGLKTAIIEKDRLGGMCLNWGCIPSKSMLESAKLYARLGNAADFGIDGIERQALSFNWQNALARTRRIVERLGNGIAMLLKKYGVEVISGSAHIASANSVKVERRLISAANIFIATGSRPGRRPTPLSSDMIWEIDELFQQQQLPETLVIMGEDATAVELAQLLALIGKKVTLIAAGDRLIPMADPYLSQYMTKRLRKSGIEVLLATSITSGGNGSIVVADRTIAAAKVINAENRQAVVPPSDVDFKMADGFIQVDSHMQTSVPGIRAIGDVNGQKTLAHVASVQGLHAVNYLKGIGTKIDYLRHPLNIYTIPEIAQIGMTEPELQAKGIDYKSNEFTLKANGKALVEGNAEGVIRLLSEQNFGEVLGVQIVAPNATDMIAEATAVMQMEGTVFDVANIVHAHPTISEIFAEAGFAAIDRAIHL